MRAYAHYFSDVLLELLQPSIVFITEASESVNFPSVYCIHTHVYSSHAPTRRFNWYSRTSNNMLESLTHLSVSVCFCHVIFFWLSAWVTLLSELLPHSSFTPVDRVLSLLLCSWLCCVTVIPLVFAFLSIRRFSAGRDVCFDNISSPTLRATLFWMSFGLYVILGRFCLLCRNWRQHLLFIWLHYYKFAASWMVPPVNRLQGSPCSVYVKHVLRFCSSCAQVSVLYMSTDVVIQR